MGEQLDALLTNLADLVPFLIVAALVALCLIALRWALHRGQIADSDARVGRSLLLLGGVCVGVVVLIMALPEKAPRDALLSFFGVLLTAVIALSSTTFVSNAMAGLMLRAVGNFRPGDFVRVGEHFGRVTEREWFHIEIQTEDRDLTTIPNMVLVTQPVSVVRHSGTIVSATVSLGYDVPHARVQPVMVRAANGTGLTDSFVQILELGDFSVTYRIAGFLGEVKQLLTARSRLRVAVLDALHDADIEIVSPTFMNQRQIAADVPVVPTVRREGPDEELPATTAEAIVFDKAERAAELEALRLEREELGREIRVLEDELGSADDDTKDVVSARIQAKRQRKEGIDALLRASDAGGAAGLKA